MNFLAAKNIVSPDKPVVPGSAEHKEIITLMRQSGRVFPEDNVPVAPMPHKSIFRRERVYVDIRPKPVSKREWLVIKTNRESCLDTSRSSVHEFQFPSTKPTPGMSKNQWLRNKITPIIIDNGPTIGGEQVQTTGET